jgi:putative acetyltransferase
VAAEGRRQARRWSKSIDGAGLAVVVCSRPLFLTALRGHLPPDGAGSLVGSAAMCRLAIAVDDPRVDDVQELLGRHLAFANECTPPEDVHALDLNGLLNAAVTVFSARRGSELLAIGALQHLDESHAELKSMHTDEAARGRGVGRAMVAHLVTVARQRGYRRVSLETGTNDAFAPARSLYLGVGFTPSGPFGEYGLSPNSTYMTLVLG